MESCRIATSIPQTIKHRFPKLISSFTALPDHRKAQGKQYAIEELLTAGLTLFLLKEGSRNQINNHRRDGYFSDHYRRMFGMRLPHQDTVADLLCALPEEHLEQIKMDSMSQLFDQKWLREYRLTGKYYMVAADATGVVSFDERHCERCLTKKSKSGKITYFHYVLEAKLVTGDGHAFSLASEWIENPSEEFDKQDCERKAFTRLAAKLKKQYPRLPVCILADGLYPYANAFKICQDNGWKFIFVLQDKSLKTVQEDLTLNRLSKPDYKYLTTDKGWWISQEYKYKTDIEYHEKYTLNWVQCIESKSKISKQGVTSRDVQPSPEVSCFEYVTNIEPDRKNVRDICTGGRLRWKIENEGFNMQKCGDYGLGHKYARKSYTGLKNYYSLLQIAHAINQLIEKAKCVREILKQRPKETLKNLWGKIKSYMIFCRPIITDYSYENVNLKRPAPI